MKVVKVKYKIRKRKQPIYLMQIQLFFFVNLLTVYRKIFAYDGTFHSDIFLGQALRVDSVSSRTNSTRHVIN